MIVNTDNIKIPIYGLILIGGTLIGVLLNSVLNHKSLQSCNKSDIVKYNALLSVVSTFSFGWITTIITSGFNSFGFSSIGGLIGMYLAYFTISKLVQSKKDKDTLLLNFALVIPLIYALTKIGCHFGSCCYGIDYNGILAIQYTGEHSVKTGAVGTRFPIQLVETITFIIVFIAFVIVRKYSKIKPIYQVSSLCTVCVIAKFLLDYLRSSHINEILSTNQIMCIGIVSISTIVSLKHCISNKHENTKINTL